MQLQDPVISERWKLPTLVVPARCVNVVTMAFALRVTDEQASRKFKFLMIKSGRSCNWECVNAESIHCSINALVDFILLTLTSKGLAHRSVAYHGNVITVVGR